MNEILIENELTAEPEQEASFDWNNARLEDWETPQAELEAEPEYKHLAELCNELGLSL